MTQERISAIQSLAEVLAGESFSGSARLATIPAHPAFDSLVTTRGHGIFYISSLDGSEASEALQEILQKNPGSRVSEIECLEEQIASGDAQPGYMVLTEQNGG